MGRASRKKRERRENPPPVPHLEVHAGLATATSAVGIDMDKEADDGLEH